MRIVFSSVVVASVMIASLGIIGCAQEKAMPPQASQAQILAGAVARAKPLLDKLEKLKPEQRSAEAHKPLMLTTLKAALADPQTKKRMDDLGIQIQ